MTEQGGQQGLDKAGLICAYHFEGGSMGAAITPEEAEALCRAPAPRGFLWLHFNLANLAADKWMRRCLSLPDDFYDALKDEALHAGSTRLEQTDAGLLAVINDVHYDFAFDPSNVSTLRLHADARIVVSARSKPLRSIDQLRIAVRAGERFSAPGELLAHLLRDQAEVMVSIVREIARRVDRIEDELLGQKLRTRAEVGSMRRVLVRLQRLLAPEPAALFRLLSRPPAWLSEAEVQDLRQSAEEFALAVGESATLAERTKLLQEEISAYTNEQNNRSLFVLTVVTVLALPFNLVGALLGMNVGGIPMANAAHGFWVVVGVVAAFTTAVGWWIVQRWRADS